MISSSTLTKKTRFKVNWAKIISLMMLLSIATLWHIGMLEPAVDYLNSKELTIKLGSARLTPYILLKGVFILTFLLWAFSYINKTTDRILHKIPQLNASDRALVIKSLSIILYFTAFLVTLSAVGIDITTISVIGGALGIGIGFGLQKIASNFISGIILLFEKTINEGDLVELPNTPLGFVKKTSARYTLLELPDGRELMIPNEDFITSRVMNYTFSNRFGRVEFNLSISSDSDPHQARNVMLNVVKNHPLCSQYKQPDVFLTSLTPTIDFTVRFWLDNVTDGKLSATSDVLFSILDEFKKNKILLPYSQMDINIKNGGLNNGR